MIIGAILFCGQYQTCFGIEFVGRDGGK